MDHLNITYHRPAELTPRAQNPRTHTKKQIRQIARSIEQFGFTNPVLLDRDGTIVAGHGRVEAAQLIGIEQVPTICLADLGPEQIRAYVIADNRLAELAGWDREILAIEFQNLAEIEIDLDLTVTGFEMPEIDILIGELDDAEDGDTDDAVPALDETPPVTRPGDIWSIGHHRLICGDALDPEVHAALLDGAKAEMVFTDPPYSVRIDGHVSGLGKTKHREFAMATGEMSVGAFTEFLGTVFRNMAAESKDGAIHFICIDWRHVAEVMAAGTEAYSEVKNLCVRAKTNGGMGSLYHSQHDLVFVFKAGQGPHINNVDLGHYRTYPGVNSFGRDRDAALAMHPTVKPVRLVADAILDCSNRGGIVLDAFAGSGTTLVGAERGGRRGYGIELDPAYCDLIVKRVAAAAKAEAIHVASGKTFAEMALERAIGGGQAASDACDQRQEAGHGEG